MSGLGIHKLQIAGLRFSTVEQDYFIFTFRTKCQPSAEGMIY